MAQHLRLLIAMLLGIVAGLTLHPFHEAEWLSFTNTHLINPMGQIFLRLIFMAVVPLIVSALILGVFELAKTAGLGKVAKRTIIFTLMASAISVFVGISLVNLLKPGSQFSATTEIAQKSLMEQSSAIGNIQKNAASAKSFSQVVVELIPKNPIDSAARALDGEIIALMVFALIFGVAMTHVNLESKQVNTIQNFLEQLYEITMKIIEFAMKLAPFGVFALVFNTVFKFGLEILYSLAFYVVVVFLGLLIQQVVVYSLLLKSFARVSPYEFIKATREVMLYAFSTASSNATLPKSLETAEKKLKLKPHVSRFVLTIGATANQNGTALFEGVTILFLAQVYGVNLDLSQQIQVVLMSILAGVGTAGVPGGSLPPIMIILQSVGIPAEGLGLILGVDRFLDMCRTTLNVTGDLVIAAVVDGTTDSRPG